MNKKSIWSLIIVIAAGVLLLFLLKNRSPFGSSNSSFASESQNEITNIEFSQGEKRLFLERKGEVWFVNGTIEARKSGILFILRILQEIKIKSPVSEGLFKSEIVDKEIVPVKVKVFEKRKLLNSFLVYKIHSNSYGNIMKIKERSKPFIVYVPGYEGDIGSAFTLNELFWQPYTLFNLMPSEITAVNFENMSDTASSFSIINKNHHLLLSGEKIKREGWDSTLIARYLSYFIRIPFESWAFEIGEEEKRKIESQQPQYILTVKTIYGNSIVLRLWERMIGENGAKTKDTDRLLGKTENSKEFFIIRYFDIDPLLKKRRYFFHE
jgi:hypothetical protein